MTRQQPQYVICRLGPAGNLELTPVKPETARRKDPAAFEALLDEMMSAGGIEVKQLMIPGLPSTPPAGTAPGLIAAGGTMDRRSRRLASAGPGEAETGKRGDARNRNLIDPGI